MRNKKRAKKKADKRLSVAALNTRCARAFTRLMPLKVCAGCALRIRRYRESTILANGSRFYRLLPAVVLYIADGASSRWVQQSLAQLQSDASAAFAAQWCRSGFSSFLLRLLKFDRRQLILSIVHAFCLELMSFSPASAECRKSKTDDVHTSVYNILFIGIIFSHLKKCWAIATETWFSIAKR